MDQTLEEKEKMPRHSSVRRGQREGAEELGGKPCLRFTPIQRTQQWMPPTSSFLFFNGKFLMGARHLIRGIDNCTVP